MQDKDFEQFANRCNAIYSNEKKTPDDAHIAEIYTSYGRNA